MNRKATREGSCRADYDVWVLSARMPLGELADILICHKGGKTAIGPTLPIDPTTDEVRTRCAHRDSGYIRWRGNTASAALFPLSRLELGLAFTIVMITTRRSSWQKMNCHPRAKHRAYGAATMAALKILVVCLCNGARSGNIRTTSDFHGDCERRRQRYDARDPA